MPVLDEPLRGFLVLTEDFVSVAVEYILESNLNRYLTESLSMCMIIVILFL